MMCGCKDTFTVSWGLGQGVRGVGVRGASGHGTPLDPLGFPGLGQGVRGLGVRLGVRGAWGHGTMNIGWQHPTTERYKHCPLQPTQNGAVTSDTNPDRYKRPPYRVVVFLWCSLWWCFWGGVFVVVFLWWCFCGGVLVVVFVWCGCVFVVVWWCFCHCGGVFVIVVMFLSLW